MLEAESLKFDGKPQYEPTHEVISDLELGNLLAGFGNHEAKAITLLAMARHPERVFTMNSLRDELVTLQGENPAWVMNNRGPFNNYCGRSLSPIGLVAKEYIDPDKGIWGYQATQYGVSVGVPFAGILLDLVAREPKLSLQRLFAATVTPHGQGDNSADRAPLARWKIIRELSRAEEFPLRVKDVATALDLQADRVSRHLECLGQEGFIAYDSIGTNNDSFVYYRASSQSPIDIPPAYRNTAQHGGYPWLTSTVWEIIKTRSDAEFSAASLASLVYEEDPNKLNNIDRHLKGTISSILSHLLKLGYLNQSSKFSESAHSEALLLPEQKIFLDELVSKIESFQRQDEEILIDGKQAARRVISNPDTVSYLLNIAKESSPIAQGISSQKLGSLAMSIVTSRPGITTRELRDAITEQGQYQKSLKRINQIAKKLAASGVLKIEKTGGMNQYFPVNDSVMEE